MEARLLAGDVEALGIIIRWIAVVLASTRFWSLRGEWVDLHQEILARVIDSLRNERFDARQDLRVYIQAMARYTALEAMRRRAASGSSLPIGSLPLADPAGDPQTLAAARQLVRIALDASSAPCRDLIRAYFLDQRDYAEIAAARGLPIGTVKSRLARCLESLHRGFDRARVRQEREEKGRALRYE